jgi:hypothetical protein
MRSKGASKCLQFMYQVQEPTWFEVNVCCDHQNHNAAFCCNVMCRCCT